METPESSNEKKNKLSQLAGAILRDAGIVSEKWKDIDDASFANFYLFECMDNSKMVNEADVSVYRRLVDIDSKLGTDAAKKLADCITSTTRLDLYEV